ncbi:MAG: hypothetical protein IPJ23_15635 [Ignavibacteriales bacterium]|nr:hypothetical protein [Ignavibacteriales bacterium]
MREDNQFGFGAGIVFDLSSVAKGLSISARWNYFKTIQMIITTNIPTK